MLQDINKEPRNNILKTPLHYASQLGHLEVVKYLMNEIKMTNKGEYILHFYLLCNIPKNILVLRRKSFKQVPSHFLEPKDKTGDTPLHWCAAMGHLDIVKYLMEEYNGSYIDREPRNIYDVTPLHAAALEGHREIVEYLMRRVRDKEPKDKDGNTILHWSAGKGHLDVIKYLFKLKFKMQKNIDREPRNNNEETPLHYAALKVMYLCIIK